MVSVLRPSGLKYHLLSAPPPVHQSRSCDRVDWNIYSTSPVMQSSASRSCDRVDWNIIIITGTSDYTVSVLRPSGLKCKKYEIYVWEYLSRSCDRVDWNVIACIAIFILLLSRSCDRVDWNTSQWCDRLYVQSLGLATEWIEMIRKELIIQRLRVSVLRPSGLKYVLEDFTGLEDGSRSCDRVDWNSKWNMLWRCNKCLGLATEWIEISISLRIKSKIPGLGLATEWIEM